MKSFLKYVPLIPLIALGTESPQLLFSDVNWHINPNEHTQINVTSDHIESCSMGLCIDAPQIKITLHDMTFDLYAATANIDQGYKVLLAKKIRMTLQNAIHISAAQAMLNNNKKAISFQSLTIKKDHFKLTSPQAQLNTKKKALTIFGPWTLQIKETSS